MWTFVQKFYSKSRSAPKACARNQTPMLAPEKGAVSFSANVRRLTEEAESKVLGRFVWRPIFIIENCPRNYWKLPSTVALIDVSLY